MDMVLLKSDNVWASYFITSCFERAEASSGHGRSGALFKKHGRDEKRHVKFFISGLNPFLETHYEESLYS